jgi:hypothetical protein
MLETCDDEGSESLDLSLIDGAHLWGSASIDSETSDKPCLFVKKVFTEELKLNAIVIVEIEQSISPPGESFDQS